jgi:hypothetical protein
VFGSLSEAVTDAIMDLSKDQADILIFGKIRRNYPTDLSKLSGHAYMSGSDSWVDIPRALGMSFTQADKVHFDESDDPLWGDAMELIEELERVFGLHASVFDDLLQRARSENELNEVFEEGEGRREGEGNFNRNFNDIVISIYNILFFAP